METKIPLTSARCPSVRFGVRRRNRTMHASVLRTLYGWLGGRLLLPCHVAQGQTATTPAAVAFRLKLK